MRASHWLVRTTFGLILTDDGGETWSWLCAKAYSGVERDDAEVAFMPDGSLVVGVIAGVRRGSSAECAFEVPDAYLNQILVSALTPDPEDAHTLYAATATQQRDNRILVSHDRAQSFAELDVNVGAGLVRSLHVAQADSHYIYAAVALPAQAAGQSAQALIYRSSDGGKQFTALPFALDDQSFEVRLVGVDPLDPLRIYGLVRRRGEEPLVLSEDGGETFRTVFRAQGPLMAFALADDGQTLWVGGEQGLWRSRDRGQTFEQLDAKRQVLCLRYHARQLWLCDGSLASDFQVGRSADDGESFRPVLHFSQIGSVAPCAEEACAVEQRDVLPELAIFGTPKSAPDAGEPASADAGAPVKAAADCSLGSAPPSRLVVFVMLGLVAVQHRRRRTKS